MWNTEKHFLEFLLNLINTSNTLADVQNNLCALACVDFDTRTTSIGTFLAISTVINSNPYVYSFFFECENDVKSDTFQIMQLMGDIDICDD